MFEISGEMVGLPNLPKGMFVETMGNAK